MGSEGGNVSASAMSPLYLPEIVEAGADSPPLRSTGNVTGGGTESPPLRSTGNVAVTATQSSGRLLSVATERFRPSVKMLLLA